MTTFAPSPYQAAIFDFIENGAGSATVVAVAGSGKSTTLGHCLARIPEHRSVHIFAFNKTIADDFKARILTLSKVEARPFAKVRASTFHSVGFGAVCKHLNRTPRQIETDGRKLRKILDLRFPKETVDAYGAFATKLVGLARGEGIGVLTPDVPEAWYKLIQHHDLELDSLDADEETAIGVARRLLAESNAAALQGHIDYDDQLYLPLLWRCRLWQNDFVFIDEAQDTNPVRRALAKLALRPGGRLIAVGDPRQAIYGFTGASHDAIDLIKAQFNAKELPLTISYRCARSIAEHARQIVSYFEPSPTAPEGKISTMPVADAIKVLGVHDAILCRNTAPLIDLAYDLIGRGVGCAVLGRDIGQGLINLVKQMKTAGVDAMLAKLQVWRDREVAKWTAKGEEQKAESVCDRVECINIVASRLPEGRDRTVPALIGKIEALFTDSNGVLILSTIHKAKGREWSTVAILKPELMPSKWARQDWQQLQEQNLIYVARTRAKDHLIYLDG